MMTRRHRTTGLLLALYLTLGAVWTWRLMPEPHDKALLPDPRLQLQERAATQLAKAPKAAALPALMALLSLSDEHLQILTAWLETPPLDQLRQLTVQSAPLHALDRSWQSLLFFIWCEQAAPVDLGEAHQMIAAAGDRLPDELKQVALGELARRAEKQGDLTMAVIILGRANELRGANWHTLHQLTAACRRVQTPAPALRALRLWIIRHADLPSEREVMEEVKNLEFSLLLETGNALEALDLQMTDLAGEAPYPEAALNRAWLAARHAHQGTRLLPVLKRHLESFEEHALEPLALASLSNVSTAYRRWLERYAAMCELNQSRATAFNSYLRLAWLRQPVALSRACALADNKPTQTQLLDALLEQALDWPETLKTVLELAQTDVLPRRVLNRRLKAEPNNRMLHFTATLASVEAHPTRPQTFLWQEFLHRFPGDADALQRLARACITEGNHALADRSYGQLPQSRLRSE